MARLDFNPPARKIGTNRRSLTGQITLTHGGTAKFESSLERDWLICLDFNPLVSTIKAQPFTLSYFFNGKKRSYTPDVMATYIENDEIHSIVYEVKPHFDLIGSWQQLQPRFEAAKNYCEQLGWKFEIITENEIRTPLLNNAKFLRKYQSVPDNNQIVHKLLFTLRALGETTPQALLAAAFWSSSSQMEALPILWKLVSIRKISIPLLAPITMSSAIWLNEENL